MLCTIVHNIILKIPLCALRKKVRNCAKQYRKLNTLRSAQRPSTQIHSLVYELYTYMFDSSIYSVHKRVMSHIQWILHCNIYFTIHILQYLIESTLDIAMYIVAGCNIKIYYNIIRFGQLDKSKNMKLIFQQRMYYIINVVVICSKLK